MVLDVLKELLKIVGDTMVPEELFLKCKEAFPKIIPKNLNVIAERKMSDKEIKFLIIALCSDRLDLVSLVFDIECHYDRMVFYSNPIRVCYIKD
jgi:hypothetical protein